MLSTPDRPRARRQRPDPREVIREVKADPDFKVHTVTDRVPKPTKTPSSELAALAEVLVDMRGSGIVCDLRDRFAGRV